ncbi:MAG TPA: AAA family ATPase [Streptosporangiaceae bacterium]|nr:AAA family ATPase [Streptosporangiaceae bacterium]
MNQETLFPPYIRRVEEEQILREAARVSERGESRAVLLYGPGGVGKTQLVRHMAQTSAAEPTTIWLDPVDIDDSEYWLLSNLERLVAHRLDPLNQYFGPYLEYLSELPNYTRPRVGQETVVSHLGRIKRVFVTCYERFIKDSPGRSVVMIFDTVEAIRGMYLLLTLTQWMKALPATLFILSGRPVIDGKVDALKNELEDPYQNIPVTTITLGEFAWHAALAYVQSSGVASGLSEGEQKKIVLLTRGHPLWLAFTIAYLKDEGLPEEAGKPLAEIERVLPYQQDMTEAGASLHEAFKRRVVAPYRETDFWHETIKRLAVVRESVSQSIWQRLMNDLPDWEAMQGSEAWQALLRIPWIRPRANRHYVTLHDAVAEELARRIIPLHDQDQLWRRQLWREAVRIYRDLTSRREAEIEAWQAALDQTLQRWDRPRRLDAAAPPAPPTEDQARFIEEAARLDAQKRELGQFKAVGLYYEILCDFAEGCSRFITLFDQARLEHDILFQDLLAFEMQRFLPVGAHAYVPGDVIGEMINGFRDWLTTDEGRGFHLDVGLSMADYLVRGEQPRTAMDLLERLPADSASPLQRYRLANLCGNACMRIRGRVREASAYFLDALDQVRQVPAPDRPKLIAAAHKELGFYYRNVGRWEEADDSYQQARDVISQTLAAGGSDEDREEMASIQTNWAYIKGLSGQYREGTNLVEAAIKVRHRLGRYQEEGISWSVCGEVYRYERRFQRAWKAYAAAEQIFQGQRDWSWLGMVYQEQAICLFQAAQDDITILPAKDPIKQAKQLIKLSLDLCRDLYVRAQPSALNRAGRIFGQEDFVAGLGYLADGIKLAGELSDGWFWFANLVEYVELSYRAWAQTGWLTYRERIFDRAPEIEEVMSQYDFPDLKGRWNLVRGHLGIHDWLASGDESRLNTALEHYKQGFAQVAESFVGSSGAAAIPAEFQTFEDLIWKLPEEIRMQWQAELRNAWSGQQGSTLLLAHLEELY